MKKAEINKKLQELELQRSLSNIESNLTRARAVTVGTCFGGTTEISMRGDGGNYLWTPMQPVEVIELIHQLAANVGCHVALKPRKDFSSWRNWRVLEEEREHLNGHPPFVNDMAPFNQVGINGIDPELEKALANDGKILEHGGGRGGLSPHRRKKNAVAIEKSENRGGSKRAAKAS